MPPIFSRPEDMLNFYTPSLQAIGELGGTLGREVATLSDAVTKSLFQSQPTVLPAALPRTIPKGGTSRISATGANIQTLPINWNAVRKYLLDKRATPAGIRMFLDTLFKTINLYSQFQQSKATALERTYSALSTQMKPVFSIYTELLKLYNQAIDKEEKAKFLDKIEQLHPYVVSYLSALPIQPSGKKPVSQLSPSLSGNTALFGRFLQDVLKNSALPAY